MSSYLLVVSYVTCGMLGAGLYNAHEQRAFPSCAEVDRWRDWSVSVVWGLLFGPVFLLVAGVAVRSADRR